MWTQDGKVDRKKIPRGWFQCELDRERERYDRPGILSGKVLLDRAYNQQSLTSAVNGSIDQSMGNMSMSDSTSQLVGLVASLPVDVADEVVNRLNPSTLAASTSGKKQKLSEVCGLMMSNT